MPASSDPLAQPGSAQPPGLIFAENWATLVRALSIYPETNSRVSATVQVALQSLEVCLAGGSLRVAFGRGQALVGNERIEYAPGTNTQWLAERLDTCGLAGAQFEPGLSAESMVTFCKQVLDSFRRSTLDSDFESWTAQPIEGVQVILRRFEGVFDGGASSAAMHLEDESLQSPASEPRPSHSTRGLSQAHLALKLLADDRIEQRLNDLAGGQAAGGEEGVESVPALKLLERLVECLPADAMVDMEGASTHTLALLAELDGQTEQDELGPAILRAGMRLFGRVSPAPERVSQVKFISAKGRGHIDDEAIHDDVDLLLGEIEQLPDTSNADLQLRYVERSDEQLGVNLHYLVTLESDEEAELLHAPLAIGLHNDTVEDRAVLAKYIEPLCDDAEQPASDLHRRRILEFLREYELTHILAQFGAFSTSMAVALFPDEFGVWLDSRDLERNADHAQLVAVLEELGTARIMEAGPYLISKARIANPGRARKLLSRAHPALIPIARLLLSRGGSQLKGIVALFVRKLESLGAEDCLLAILPDEQLPRDYLATLLDPPSTPTARSRLHARISHALCDFIKQTSGQDEALEKRIEAIQHLGTFESPRSLDLLKGLLGARRFLLLHEECPQVREAARLALASRA